MNGRKEDADSKAIRGGNGNLVSRNRSLAKGKQDSARKQDGLRRVADTGLAGGQVFGEQAQNRQAENYQAEVIKEEAEAGDNPNLLEGGNEPLTHKEKNRLLAKINK